MGFEIYGIACVQTSRSLLGQPNAANTILPFSTLSNLCHK